MGSSFAGTSRVGSVRSRSGRFFAAGSPQANAITAARRRRG